MIAMVFWAPTNPTFVTFSLVLYRAKLHSESKYDENFDSIDSFDFLFLIKDSSLSVYILDPSVTSYSVGLSENIWTVPLSELQASHRDFRSKAKE